MRPSKGRAACSSNQAGCAGPQFSCCNCRLPCVRGHSLLCCVCMSSRRLYAVPYSLPWGSHAGWGKPVKVAGFLPCRCVGLGASGRLYVGVNLEFPCLPLHNSVHAEQFLVVNALQHGELELVKLAVSAAPCGHCRQFLSELCCAVREGAAFSCVMHVSCAQAAWGCVVSAICAKACQLCGAHINQTLLIAVGEGWLCGAMLEHAATCQAEPRAAFLRQEDLSTG